MSTTRHAAPVALLSAALILAGCGDSSSPPAATPTPSSTLTARATATPTSSSTMPPSATPTASLTRVPTASATPPATATLTPLPTLSPLPVGLAAITDLDALAELRLPGTRVEQVSSYDRTGGNADLGVGPDTAELLRNLGSDPTELDNSYLYRDGDRYVIFDQLGPGVVYRIWMTGLDALFRGALAGDIAFEIDDESEPRLQLTRSDMFSGTHAPFLAPLAGNSAVSAFGFYTVVPIPFAHHLRILTSTAPNWVQITYALLPPDQSIASFDPLADTSAAAAVLAAAGEDPRPATAPAAEEIALDLTPGAEVTWHRTGPGTIKRIELLAPAGAEIPTDVRLLATWDNAATPQVDAPLDDFFAAALGPAAHSLAFGRDGDRFYCYFAMPFRSDARLVLRNDGDSAALEGWRLRITATDEAPAARAAGFFARAHAARLEPDGADYIMLDTGGSGHVVGVVLTAGCAEQGHCRLPQIGDLDGSHLEGDEHVSIDGSRYPQIHGTGLEDFFNGGFYFLGGPVTLPTHGNPAQPATSPRRPGLTLRSAYRLLLGDAIPFSNHIRLAIEHGPTNDVPAEMSSLVFYYAIADATLVQTDKIEIGVAASEAAHAFAADARVDRVLQSSFRGDASEIPVDASGIDAAVTRFRVAIDPANRGVRLRRLADIAQGRQTALVVVDGTAAGTWYTPDVNPNLRWADLDFEIPAAVTSGRSTLEITLDAAASPTPWTAFGYTVFSHVEPPAP